MHGLTRPDRAGAKTYVYYLCPHRPSNPRHAQAHPQHTRVSVNEEIITAALAQFMDIYLLGHDRAAMLQVQLPAGAAEQAKRRDRQAEALRQKLARIETAAASATDRSKVFDERRSRLIDLATVPGRPGSGIRPPRPAR
jgi:hypothetical protein